MINPAASLWYFSNSALYATRSLKQGPFLLRPPGRRWWRGSETVLSWPIWSPPTWGTQTKACSPPARWESCCGGTKTACSKPSRLHYLSWMMFSDSSIRSHLSLWIRYCRTDWTVFMKMCDRCQLQRYIRISFWLKFLFSHRAMLPTMVNMCSSLGSKTTKTLQEWIHGRVKGNHLRPSSCKKKWQRLNANYLLLCKWVRVFDYTQFEWIRFK